MLFIFFFNDTATTEIYTLSLHDALPILFIDGSHQFIDILILLFFYLFIIDISLAGQLVNLVQNTVDVGSYTVHDGHTSRSEEHTSELQSRQYLVCRLLLEKKKNIQYRIK